MDWKKNFYSCLRISYSPLKYVCTRKPYVFAIFSAHALREGCGHTNMNVTTIQVVGLLGVPVNIILVWAGRIDQNKKFDLIDSCLRISYGTLKFSCLYREAIHLPTCYVRGAAICAHKCDDYYWKLLNGYLYCAFWTVFFRLLVSASGAWYFTQVEIKLNVQSWTSAYNFYMARSKTRSLTERIFDSRLRIKVMAPSVFTMFV